MIEQEQLIPASEYGLIGYWPFDEGPKDEVGNSAYDVSALSNHGNIIGATYREDTPAAIYGCTDDSGLALNYNSEANVDDGSCIYEPLQPTNLTAEGGEINVFSVELNWAYEGVISENNPITFSVFKEVENSDEDDWLKIAEGLTATEYIDDHEIDYIEHRCYKVQGKAVESICNNWACLYPLRNPNQKARPSA